MYRLTFAIGFLISISVFASESNTAESRPSMGLAVHALVDPSRPHWTKDEVRPMLTHAFYPTS